MRNIIIILALAMTVNAQWIKLNSETTKNLNSLFFINAKKGHAVGENSSILETNDGGKNWYTNYIESGLTLNGVFFENEDKGWIVGYDTYSGNGILYYTTNGGSNWQTTYLTTSGKLNSLQFVGTTAYVIGDNSQIYKKTNSGWSKLTPITGDYKSCSFVNENIGYVAGTGCIKTTNGGSSWISLPALNNKVITKIQFISQNIGYCLTSDGLIRTTDGGNQWSSIHPSGVSSITAFYFQSSALGFLAAGGNIYKTTNSGSNWQLDFSNVGHLSSIFLVDNNTGYAAGKNGLLYKYTTKTIKVTSPAKGMKWIRGTTQSISWTDNNVDTVSIYYLNGGPLFSLVVSKYSSTNNSFSWIVPATVSNSCRVMIRDYTEDLVYVISDTFSITHPVVLTSPNGGEEWMVSVQKSITWTAAPTVSQIKLQYSTNNGSTWNIISDNISANLGSYIWTVPNFPSNSCLIKITDVFDGTSYDISDANFSITPLPSVTITRPKEGELFIVSQNEYISYSAPSISSVKIEYSTNGGSNWLLITNNAPGGYQNYQWQVPITPSENCRMRISSNDNPNIFKINEGNFIISQIAWQSLSTGFNVTGLSSVEFIDLSFGSTCGSGGKILLTRDGGMTWTSTELGISTFFYDITFKNTSTGWVVGSQGSILKTTNGGLSWVFQNSGTTKDIFSISMINEEIGWATGQNGIILKTTNGGNTWTIQQSGVVTNLNKVLAVTQNTVFLVGDGGSYLKSTDAGASWIRQPIGTSNNLFSIQSVDYFNVFIVGSNGTILKSTDLGDTWSNKSITSFYYDLNEVDFSSASVGFVVGGYGRIFRTSDSGNSWLPSATNVNDELLSVSFPSTTIGYAVGWGGRVLKTVNGGATFIDEREIDNISRDYSLLQNYPNPFNPSTTIEYNLPKDGKCQLTIFDLLGKIVKTINSENQKAGNHKVTLDFTGFSSGIYIYELRSNEFISRKKMIFLK